MSAWNFPFLPLYCSLLVVGTVAVFRGWASSACVACDDGFSSCFLLTQRTYTQRKALSGRIIPVKIDRYSHPIYHARHTHTHIFSILIVFTSGIYLSCLRIFPTTGPVFTLVHFVYTVETTTSSLLAVLCMPSLPLQPLLSSLVYTVPNGERRQEDALFCLKERKKNLKRPPCPVQKHWEKWGPG